MVPNLVEIYQNREIWQHCASVLTHTEQNPFETRNVSFANNFPRPKKKMKKPPHAHPDSPELLRQISCVRQMAVNFF